MTTPVNAENFERAESDMYFAEVVQEGGLGKFKHHRELMPVDKQTIIRSNRDTLYSSAVFDLQAGPVQISLPNAHGRFMSLMALDEEEYVLSVVYEPGTYTFTQDGCPTRYMFVAIRTLIDPSDREDLRDAFAAQDEILVRQESRGQFEVPAWDADSRLRIHNALLELSATVPDSRHMFGRRGEVDPLRHLIGSAAGWGGNPEQDAVYVNVAPQYNDGLIIHRLVVPPDVPVDAFWSISVYNAAGFFEKNQENRYSLNSYTATREPDGSVLVQFGGAESGIANCLPIMRGWNYLVRLYRPRAEILGGSWAFPEAIPVE